MSDDECRCQFCRHRRDCTTPGDVNCKQKPKEIEEADEDEEKHEQG